ncbi:hypothetical protein AGMMS49938_10500 [Fibrobacterales bacterium]|nr:hypothetical protein AGMMS49938_10500 [Fibrobacterales bacterium]
MSYNIIPTHHFAKELKRLVKKYPSLKTEYSQLITSLEETPQLGVSLGNNLLEIYDKSEMANIKDHFIEEILQELGLN